MDSGADLNHTPKYHQTRTCSNISDHGPILGEVEGVDWDMPEQVPRRVPVLFAPIIIFVAIVTMLSMPVILELARSLGSVFDQQSTIQASDLYLRSDRIGLLIRSLAIAGFIGLVGVCMGIPVGQVLSAKLDGQRRVLAAVLLSPIWLPAIMVYAAGNILRAPDTLIGRAIISFSTSSEDLRWVTIWAGYAIAVLGLAIWSAPIAGVLIASGLGFRSNLYQEMIALEPVGIFGRAKLWVRLHLGVLFRAWVLVTVLMLGSAVPMHLAQLETWSIVIWRQLAEHPIDEWGAIWLSAWPMVIVGVIGAWLLTRTVIKREEQSPVEDRGHSGRRVPKVIMLMAMAVWAMGALVPMAAMLFTLDDFGSLIQFWRIEASAMRDSGLIALATGAATATIAALTAITLAHPAVSIRRVSAMGVLILCILGLIPGVLVGAAIARSPMTMITQGWGGALLASCIRIAFLGAVIGALCAASETYERKSVRWQIAGGSIRGWVSTTLPGIWTAILGSGLLGGLYSMYEIEASVMVRPPGMENLPQQLLSDLHYARLEQLSAAGVNLLGIGLVCSIIGTMLIARIRTED